MHQNNLGVAQNHKSCSTPRTGKSYHSATAISGHLQVPHNSTTFEAWICHLKLVLTCGYSAHCYICRTMPIRARERTYSTQEGLDRTAGIAGTYATLVLGNTKAGSGTRQERERSWRVPQPRADARRWGKEHGTSRTFRRGKERQSARRYA